MFLFKLYRESIIMGCCYRVQWFSEFAKALGVDNLSKASLSDDKSVLTAPLYRGMLSRIKPRLDQTLPIGSEVCC